ncbi:MBL fold metallo-hydrolase [Octadecabacter sp. G9-8]|uniref:MBL fold metallo-hydrolase n=1 Tax=Octadecabacter dasysiphoniae TaxID=2909341 RepID=A0ABS9D108_9RHOB|nr:MBL fold metallo-hydrolase [Octadecabacter dasysiphoniae]MCF2872754.1 MBL fold metallo-hydrolase [Octadecabacter dasysiphoniae]
MQSRRTFLATTGTAVTLLPFTFGAATADGHAAANTFDMPNGGQLKVMPVSHASFLMDTGDVLIAVDPIGDPAQYNADATPGLVIVTHFHGDHFDLQTLIALTQDADTQLVVNAALIGMLPEDLAARAIPLANDEDTTSAGVAITAIPAYNVTEGRLEFHPKGRDNGYVLDIDGFRVYISGDTEDTPEMRALENIDLAFVCMNLPFTMDAEAAASAVSEFAPTYVYPYHYRGRDDGTQDPAEFASMLSDGIEAKMGDWYG